MKFSEIDAADWPQLRPYLDTCLLPVTGLAGGEEPSHVVLALERLRDLLDEVEIPFKGRVVTYPAFHYIMDEPALQAALENLCKRLKENGFAYVIMAVSGNAAQMVSAIEGCDLIISDEHENAAQLKSRISAMWATSLPSRNL